MFCKNCGAQVPEGVAFCASCGTPVATAPVAAAPVAAAPVAANPAQAAVAAVKNNGTIKLIAIVAAVAIVLGLLFSLLGGDSAKSVAKKYIKAEIEGDLKAQMSLCVGKMQKMFEKETDDDMVDLMFEGLEEQADELDIKAKVNNFNQFYNVGKKVTKAQNKETYGKNFKVTVEVRKVKDMRNKDIDAIQDAYDNDAYEDYVNVDKIKKGKIVTVKVIIDGKEDSVAYDRDVQVVKYKGQWKVVDISMGAMSDLGSMMEDALGGMDMGDLEDALGGMSEEDLEDMLGGWD